jgi:PAS domain S-box-containing protein
MARDSPTTFGNFPPASHHVSESDDPHDDPSSDPELTALLDAVFAATQVGLAYIDRDLRYRRISPFLAAMNGQPVEAHLGRRPSEVLGPPGAVLEELLRGILATGEALTDFEVETLTPAGGVIHLRANLLPVRVRGEVVGVCGIILDVTAIKQAEASLRTRQAPS